MSQWYWRYVNQVKSGKQEGKHFIQIYANFCNTYLTILMLTT